MNNVLDWNKPHQRFFEEMTRIPHGSGNEQQYSDYLVEFAKERNFKYKQYPKGSVIIYKGGSQGYETHPAVVLQGHIDMVCEKNADSTHDFTKDPLDIYVEDGWIYARGTTLGADDGMGVSYMLALLDSKDVAHPPLECIFTVCEEVDMSGADELEPSDIKGRRFIGLDDYGGGDWTIVSTAGGIGWGAQLEAKTKPATGSGYRLAIKGLVGGHSGVDIHLERGNAIKLCARALNRLNGKLGITLAGIYAGSADNAIPRECFAEFETKAPEKAVRAVAAELEATYKDELSFTDAEVFIELEAIHLETVWEQHDSDKMIDFLVLCPTGLRHRSMAIEGLTTASENLAVIKCEENVATVIVSMRADRDSLLYDMLDELETLGKVFGLPNRSEGYYPGWPFEKDSAMRELLIKCTQKLLGKTPVNWAAHGGLEGGIFKSKWPDMDIVTLGPTMEAEHTPEERLNIQSFDECYEVLKEMLINL